MQHLKPNDAALEARDKLNETTNRSLNTQSFDRAWQRVYGTKEYRPSWIGSLPTPRPRPTNKSHGEKPILRVNDEPLLDNTDEVIAKFPKEDRQKVKEFYDLQVQCIPTEHRSKRIQEPLLLNGKVVPRERELGKWREMIELEEVDGITGEPLYNRVVKATNVPNWMNSNSYWRANNKNDTFERMDQTISPSTSGKLREKQVIHTAKYDLVGKYENKIAPLNLKLEGKKELPSKRELKKWGDQLEIPQKLEMEDYISDLDSNEELNRGSMSEKRRKFNSVLKQADVPGFFSHNNYWK